MGQVLKCKDKKLKRIVAVKQILKDLDDDSIARFHHEAKITSLLDHPNILKIYDFGQAENGDLYMVMDYLDGDSLKDWIDSYGSLGFKEAGPIFLQICEGLEYAHSKNVLHRDIKPSNVILVETANNDIQVKLVDFGLAKANEVDHRITKTGYAVGSPAYMSPEQSLGKETDERSDIYNIGCTLFQVLTGQSVFGTKNPLKVLGKQIKEKPPKLEDKSNKEFHPKVEELVAKCLEKEPAKRYSNVAELKSAIAKALEESEISAEQSSVVEIPQDKNSNAIFSLILLLVAGAFALSIIYYAYSFFENQTLNTSKQDSRAFKVDNHFGQAPMDLGYVVNKSKGFRVKTRSEGKRYIVATANVFDSEFRKAAKKYKDSAIKNWEIHRSPYFSGSGLSELRDLPITSLKINKTILNDTGIKSLSEIKSLKRLSIQRCDLVTEEGLSYLAELPRLEYLILSECNLLENECMKEVAKISTLKFLTLSSCEVTGKKIRPLINTTNLRKLQIAHCRIRKSAFNAIGRIPNLTELVLYKAHFSKAGISNLPKDKLLKLSISQSKLTPPMVNEFTKLKSLKKLVLDKCIYKKEELDRIKEALPDCEVVIQ